MTNGPSVPVLSEPPDPSLFPCLALAFFLAEVQEGTVITLGVLGLCSYISVSIYHNKHFFPFSKFLIRVQKLAQGYLNISRAQCRKVSPGLLIELMQIDASEIKV